MLEVSLIWTERRNWPIEINLVDAALLCFVPNAALYFIFTLFWLLPAHTTFLFLHHLPLYVIIPHHTSSPHIARHYTTLHYTTLHYTTPHLLTPHHTSLLYFLHPQRALRSQLDCVPTDYGSLFRFVDTDEDGLVTLNQVRMRVRSCFDVCVSMCVRVWESKFVCRSQYVWVFCICMCTSWCTSMFVRGYACARILCVQYDLVWCTTRVTLPMVMTWFDRDCSLPSVTRWLPLCCFVKSFTAMNQLNFFSLWFCALLDIVSSSPHLRIQHHLISHLFQNRH